MKICSASEGAIKRCEGGGATTTRRLSTLFPWKILGSSLARGRSLIVYVALLPL